VRLTLLNQPEDNVVLLLAFHGHEVHTVLPAYVARIQPVNSRVAVLRVVAAKEVVVSAMEELFGPCNTNYNNSSASLNLFLMFTFISAAFISFQRSDRPVWVLLSVP
jgi:hypothetical protein